MSAAADRLEWKLKKYARFTEVKPARSEDTSITSNQPANQYSTAGEWQCYDGTTGGATLVLTGSLHLLVIFGTLIQENYYLMSAGDSIRGVSRGDTLLLLIKLKDSTRRFRVQFKAEGTASGASQCGDCVRHLAAHINIKRVAETEVTATRETCAPALQGPAAVSQMAQLLRGAGSGRLPLAYQQASIATGPLDTLLRLCLTDATFPALVGAVQDKLQEISGEIVSTKNDNENVHSN